MGEIIKPNAGVFNQKTSYFEKHMAGKKLNTKNLSPDQMNIMQENIPREFRVSESEYLKARSLRNIQSRKNFSTQIGSFQSVGKQKLLEGQTTKTKRMVASLLQSIKRRMLKGIPGRQNKKLF